MKKTNRTIVTECVSCGHPDKIADQMSDALLEYALEQDPNTRSGVEVLVKDSTVVFGGEITTLAPITQEVLFNIAKTVYNRLGFAPYHNLDETHLNVINLLGKQSPEISNGIHHADNTIGAGDQGFVVGYASNDTFFRMPWGVYLSRVIVNEVNKHAYLGPDAKSQVTIRYGEDGVPEITHVLVSTQHDMDVKVEDVRKAVGEIIENVVEDNTCGYDDEEPLRRAADFSYDVNPCGSWVIGGPVSDCGVTGRKLVVDQYGGYCNIGGGAFSGKDFTKVDRSAAYMTRYLARNIVTAGIADEAKVTLAYAIGVPEPTAIDIVLDRNQEMADRVREWVKANVDLTPNGIIKRFGNGKGWLNGCDHFESTFPWEQDDIAGRMAKELKN